MTKSTEPELWAVYVATPGYGVQGITLHASEIDAWRAVIAYVGTGREYPEPGDAATTEELAEWCEEYAEEQGTDYLVDRVTLPAATVQGDLPEIRPAESSTYVVP
jgi:hypothetical protein